MHIVTRNAKKETKSFFGMVILLSILTGSILLAGFINAPDEPKKYKLEMTIEEIQTTMYVVEKSTAEHNVVEAVKKIIADQVNPVLQMEAKKTQDSLDKLKVKPKQ